MIDRNRKIGCPSVHVAGGCEFEFYIGHFSSSWKEIQIKKKKPRIITPTQLLDNGKKKIH